MKNELSPRKQSHPDNSSAGGSEEEQLEGLISSLPSRREKRGIPWLMLILLLCNVALLLALLETYMDKPKRATYNGVVPEREQTHSKLFFS